MKQVILDTSFILTCLKQKIDFFEELELEGYQIIIPKQVLNELKGLKSKLALDLLSYHKYKTIDLDSKNVDDGIIRYAEENPEVIVGTLDKGIQDEIKNKKIIIRGMKKLEVV